MRTPSEASWIRHLSSSTTPRANRRDHLRLALWVSCMQPDFPLSDIHKRRLGAPKESAACYRAPLNRVLRHTADTQPRSRPYIPFPPHPASSLQLSQQPPTVQQPPNPTMSSQNAGTNSPKNEQANPLGSSSVEGKTSQGISGEQQRSGGTFILPIPLQ